MNCAHLGSALSSRERNVAYAKDSALFSDRVDLEAGGLIPTFLEKPLATKTFLMNRS
jgi:hypothetical protein